jgi:hypothetical protein
MIQNGVFLHSYANQKLSSITRRSRSRTGACEAPVLLGNRGYVTLT